MIVKIIRLPHGYFNGEIVDICPSLTISSFEFNNLIMEIYDKDNPSREHNTANQEE